MQIGKRALQFQNEVPLGLGLCRKGFGSDEGCGLSSHSRLVPLCHAPLQPDVGEAMPLHCLGRCHPAGPEDSAFGVVSGHSIDEIFPV